MSAAPLYTILVVEDHADSRQLLCSALRDAGYRVSEAKNGKQAIVEASRQHPDLIVMDLAMPEMDGVQASRRILQVPKLADIPILAVTAYATDDVKADAISAGCREVLVKPIDIAVLLQKISGTLSAGSASQTTKEDNREHASLGEVERVQTSIPTNWGLTPDCPHQGTITSLSIKGCLIQSGLVVALTGKPIFINFRSPIGPWMSLQGEVLYYLRGVGFGMGFTQLTAEDQHILAALVEHHRTGAA